LNLNNFSDNTIIQEDVRAHNSNILIKFTKLIDEIRFKIEKKLFNNKSICYIDNDKYNYFLLIINDGYIPKIGYISNNDYKNDIDENEYVGELLDRVNFNEFYLKDCLN
jgi:hypothetical protein